MKGKRLQPLLKKAGIAAGIGIFELMLMTSKIRELTFCRCAPRKRSAKASIKQGMTTLYSDGILKAMKPGSPRWKRSSATSKRTED